MLVLSANSLIFSANYISVISIRFLSKAKISWQVASSPSNSPILLSLASTFPPKLS
jgi:hypothetical protein